MDRDFHELLTRYVNGTCSPSEIEKINRWYDEIGKEGLALDDKERLVMRDRILSHLRTGHPETTKLRSNRRYLITHPSVRIAAAILMIFLCGLWVLYPGVTTREIAEQTPAAAVFENTTELVRMYLLPDGSEVKLEPAARIEFNRGFSAGGRQVHLTGKAFFDIVRDPAHPFYVYSDDVAVRVLGTSFVVNAPKNAAKVEVKVITGRVSVFPVTRKVPASSELKKGAAANGVVLSPNQTVEYFVEEGHWVTGLVEEPVPVKPLEEKDLSFVFSNTPMREVLLDINERYGIEVVTESEGIYNCTFTGDVSKMSLYDMLDVISNSIGSTYEVKGTRILVSGKGCQSGLL